MSILSKHFPEVLDELNADPDRPEQPEPTEAEINAMAEAAGQLLAKAPRKPRKPRAKPVRTVRVSVPATADNPFTIITITQGHDVDDYIVRPIASDWGTAFQVEKVFDPEQKVYHVNLDTQGQGQTCDCKGFVRWGHCKHASALVALREHGKL